MLSGKKKKSFVGEREREYKLTKKNCNFLPVRSRQKIILIFCRLD